MRAEQSAVTAGNGLTVVAAADASVRDRYAGSEILQMYFPFTIMVDTPVVGERGLGLRSHSAALAANTIGVSTWLLIAWLMARNKIFINV